MFSPIYSWVVSSFSTCTLSCSVATVCCLVGGCLDFHNCFLLIFLILLSSFFWSLCNSCSVKTCVIPYPKNEGPNRLQPQSLTRPRVKCLVLSHILGAYVVFPCPPFLLPWALMFVISLLLPLQTKGPNLVPILRLTVSLLESFQLCLATSWRGVMPLQQIVGLPLCYTHLAWSRPTSSTRSLLLHQLDAFECRFSELQVESCATLSFLRTVPQIVRSVHCRPVGFG
jgi:hypothetical protein